jgi:hypothetical protein
MKKEDRQEFIPEILETVHIKKREINLLESILNGQEILPCLFISLDTISKLSFKSNEVGLSNYLEMGRGPYDASWKLVPDAVSNYRIKKRNETIKTIIA